MKFTNIPFLSLQILIQSVCERLVPKLVSKDIPLLHSLFSGVFPGVKYTRAEMGSLRAEIGRLCAEMHLVAGEGDSPGAYWVEKVSEGEEGEEEEREEGEVGGKGVGDSGRKGTSGKREDGEEGEGKRESGS